MPLKNNYIVATTVFQLMVLAVWLREVVLIRKSVMHVFMVAGWFMS